VRRSLDKVGEKQEDEVCRDEVCRDEVWKKRRVSNFVNMGAFQSVSTRPSTTGGMKGQAV
jgi:hypothetical protein